MAKDRLASIRMDCLVIMRIYLADLGFLKFVIKIMEIMLVVRQIKHCSTEDFDFAIFSTLMIFK